MGWREYEGKSNPLIPQNIAQLLWLLMRNARASLKQSPAVLARGNPMNPTRGKMKAAARETRPDSMSELYDGKISKDEFTKLYKPTEYEQGRDDVKRNRGLEALARAAPQTHTHGA